MADENKPIIAGILSLIIPGLGQFFINSKYALHYFGVGVAIFIVSWIVITISFGICMPIWIVMVAYNIVSAIDAYYEANGQASKRLLRNYIK